MESIQKIQRSFTKHITGMHGMPYYNLLGLYALHIRKERYFFIYFWKIVESLVLKFSNTITSTFSERRYISCVITHVNVGCVGTLTYNSLRWHILNLSFTFNVLVFSLRFKTQLDIFFVIWKCRGSSLPGRNQPQP